MANILTIVLTGFCIALTLASERPINIGKFHTFDHGVKSGRVQIMDEKTIRIQDFHYLGDGPDAWFVVGNDEIYTEEKPVGGLPFTHIVPDENGRCLKPKKYSGKTIELTLPGSVTTADISYLAVYCITFNHNFGYIKIPKELRPPASSHNGPTKTCPKRRSSRRKSSSSSRRTQANNRTTDNKRTVRRIITLLRMLE